MDSPLLSAPRIVPLTRPSGSGVRRAVRANVRIPSSNLRRLRCAMRGSGQRMAEIENPGVAPEHSRAEAQICKNSSPHRQTRCSRAISLTCSTPAELSQRLRCALRGATSRRIFRSIKRSRCACISSAISAFRLFLETNRASERTRREVAHICYLRRGRDRFLWDAKPMLLFR